jgi:6,7-dimethyl-8-ribityllumazine synthase
VRITAAKQEANVRHGSVVAKPNQKYGVVVGRFNDLVTKLLLEGAYGAFESHGVSLSDVEVRMWQQ